VNPLHLIPGHTIIIGFGIELNAYTQGDQVLRQPLVSRFTQRFLDLRLGVIGLLALGLTAFA